MKKWSSRLLAFTLCAALILGQGGIVSATGAGETTPEMPSEVVEETIEEVSEEISEEVSEEISEEVSEEISEEVSEEISEEVSEEISEEVSEEISEEVSEEISEEVSEEISEEVSEEISEEVSEEISEEAVEFFPGMDSAYSFSTQAETYRASMVENEKEIGELIEGVNCVPGEIIVFAETQELAYEYAEAFNGTLKEYFGQYAVITLNADEQYGKVTVAQAVKASIDNSNNLPVAWPNKYYQLHTEPIEESAQSELCAEPYMSSDNGNYQWFHTTIGSSYAWNAGYKGKGVKVAVIDSGTNLTHEDITGGRYSAYSEISDDAKDISGHGTHVSGLIGASLNNKGGAGVAPEATIISYKVTDGSEINSAGFLKAINNARTAKVDIINMSLGGAGYDGSMEAEIDAAYKEGIASIVSAGNESTNGYMSPGSFKNVICIAALDQANQKTDFSNYGSYVDYAMPGKDILSTAYNGNSAYAYMNGTSQAAPIATGTAAVLLGYARANNLYTEQNNEKDVANLRKLMDKGVVKANGTGLGKGYIKLSKALGLADATTAPKAPVVVNNKPGKYTSTTVAVTLNAEYGNEIWYSVDGKTPAYKNGVVTNAVKYTGAVTIGNAKTVTLKAIAISPTHNVSKVLTAKYTFEPLVESISLLPANLTQNVLQGKSLTIKATVLPAYAKNKSLKWSVEPAGQGVKVSNGKVTVAKNATMGTYLVTAESKDSNAPVVQAIKIYVVEAAKNPITSVKLAKSGTVNLYAGDERQPVDIVVKYKDKTTSANPGELIWYSSDYSIADFSVINNKIHITPRANGKATITGVAKDGYGAKISIPVNVKADVTDISLSAAALTMAKGTSATVKATVVPAEAKNTKISWSVSPDDGNVTVKNGKITVKKTAMTATYGVFATAIDHKGNKVSNYLLVDVLDTKITKISIPKECKTIEMLRVVTESTSYESKSKVFTPIIEGTGTERWTIINSNPAVATVHRVNGNDVAVYSAGKAGTATITLQATDGTNKKASFTVKVKNPASALHISPQKGRSNMLAIGKSMKLTSSFETEYGKIDSSAKKLGWISANENILSVSSNGTVKVKTGVALNQAMADAMANETDLCVEVYALTLDGSCLVDVIEIYITADVAELTFDSYYSSLVGAPAFKIRTKQRFYIYDNIFSVSTKKIGVDYKIKNGYLIVGVYGYKGAKNYPSDEITVTCMNGSTAKAKLKIN